MRFVVYACDMMSTGFMGAEHAAIPIGGSVTVFSQGPVGLMATAGARLLGAGLVIADQAAYPFSSDHEARMSRLTDRVSMGIGRA